MELELGLKIAKTSDDLTSMAEFQFAKDRTGPVFLSGEDDNLFILTVHLKGFRRDNINIKINEYGTRITVHGEKRVQQTVMIGWILHKKGVELRVFKKVFKIPDGVVLDRIKARFNEDESILTIIMPKREKGIRGDGIEEVKEDEVGTKTGKSEREQIVDNEVSERDKDGLKNLEESKDPEIKRMDETDPVVVKETSEMTTIVEEIPRKDTVGERIYEKSKETEILSQPAEEEAGKRGLELEATKTVVKEFPEREYIGEKVLEKSKQPKMKRVEETDGVVKEKVGREKPETVTIVAKKVPKGEKEAQEPESKIAKETQPIVETSEKVKEITHERELGEVDPKNLETVLTSKHPEGNMKPTIETWSKELPGLAEHKIIQEPHDLMAHTDVQESTKSKADQEELEQAETQQRRQPVEQLGKDEVTKLEKTISLGNEIREASNEGSLQEKEGESEQEKDLGEGFPNRELPSLKSELWKEMGWQGPDPSTDFRGGGFISLENLIFFAQKYPESFQRLLHKQDGTRAEWEYPFAVAGINISFLLAQMLDLQSGKPTSLAGIRFLELLGEDEMAFDNLYCVAFQMLDAQWLAKRASYMDFNDVLKSTRTQLERELALEDVFGVRDLPAYNLLRR